MVRAWFGAVYHALDPHRDAEDARWAVAPGTGPKKVRITRRISEDGRFVVKASELQDESRSFQARVRLLPPAELAALLADAGFAIAAREGAYDVAPLNDDASGAILVGAQGAA